MKNKVVRPWERQKTATPYRRASFEQNKTILIVCEGQTEAEYFASFDVVQLKVVCEDSKGRTKRQLVEYCENKIKEYRKQSRNFDECWCVFDMDVKRGRDQFADFDTAIASAEAKGYKVAYSNDAFELWFYLHYQFTDQQNLRTFYYEQLGKLWNINYEKKGKVKEFCCKVYDLLASDKKASQADAIGRAEKLCENCEHLPHSQRNPATTVHLLVKELNKYLRGIRRS